MKLKAFWMALILVSAGLVGCGSPSGETASNTPAANTPAEGTETKPPSEEMVQIDLNTLKGQELPAFTLTSLTGEKIESSSWKGSPVLLDFWANWCVNCKAASTTIQKWYEAYKDKGLKVYAVNALESFALDKPETDKGKLISLSKEKTDAYMKEHPDYTFEFAVFGDDLLTSWQVSGVPAFVLIDKDGKLVSLTTGTKPEQMAELEKQIAAQFSN